MLGRASCGASPRWCAPALAAEINPAGGDVRTPEKRASIRPDRGIGSGRGSISSAQIRQRSTAAGLKSVRCGGHVIRVYEARHSALDGAGHPMVAFCSSNIHDWRFRPRRQGRPSPPSLLRRIGRIVALLSLLAAATVAKATSARADDWQLCINQSATRSSPRSAVIRQQARDPAELSRAYVRRGGWYRMHNRFDEAWADMEQAEKLAPNSAIVGHGPLLVQKGRYEEPARRCLTRSEIASDCDRIAKSMRFAHALA